MATEHRLRVHSLPGRFAVCRLPAEAEVPSWAAGPTFVSITRTSEELSIVCAEDGVPGGAQCERGYAAFRVAGALAPELVGILASLAVPLANAEIPILAVGTYDTDYLLVRDIHRGRAIEAMRRAGHVVEGA